MNKPPVSTSRPPKATADAWAHELRNALNLVGLRAAMAQRFLQQGNEDNALDSLAECRQSWHDCVALLDRMPRAAGETPRHN